MTIIRCRRQVAGVDLNGFQISCHNPECHGSNFLSSPIRLPDQKVANLFRERGWEVNSSGKDFCPNCIIKRRGPKKGSKHEKNNVVERIIPDREHLHLSAKNIAGVVKAAGLPPAEVHEIEHKHRKFQIIFRINELHFGKLIHAESEILQTFPKVALQDSYLKSELRRVDTGNAISLELVMYWYLVLEETYQFMAAE